MKIAYNERTATAAIGAVIGAVIGTIAGLLLTWAAFGIDDAPIGALTGVAGSFIGAVFVLEKEKGKLVKCSLSGAIVGAIVGMAFLGVFGLIGAPRHWVTVTWMIGMLLIGGSAGIVGGLVVGTIAWLSRRWAIIGNISYSVGATNARRVVEILLGGLVGVTLGCLAGAAIEVVIGMKQVVSSPNGFLFYTDDLTMTVYIAPGIGIVLGIIYGLVGGVTDRAIERLTTGITSGVIFGIGVGAVSVVIGLITSAHIVGSIYVAVFLAVSALILGIPVGLISQLAGRLVCNG